MARTARHPLVPLAAAGAAVLLSGGCGMADFQQLIDPQRADDLYAAPSDGVQVELTEQLRAENLLVVTTEEGEPGRLTGALVNDSRDEVSFTLVVAEERLEIDVPADGTVLLGIDEPAEVDAVPAAPGATTQVTLSAGATGAVTSQIPVLDQTLPPYEDYAP